MFYNIHDQITRIRIEERIQRRQVQIYKRTINCPRSVILHREVDSSRWIWGALSCKHVDGRAECDIECFTDEVVACLQCLFTDTQDWHFGGVGCWFYTLDPTLELEPTMVVLLPGGELSLCYITGYSRRESWGARKQITYVYARPRDRGCELIVCFMKW